MKGKKHTATFMILFLFALMLCWKPNDVSAAARQVRLSANRMYKNYKLCKYF